ncbi:hypothetical protein [Novipirellula artificiosorum]|uniref:Uncharacterized protein n=1 Tax=Novipirellula artificiosorum TaxID=2528016 RepID=A0A5C6E1N7_9BACT|nr:hypothetical protein [Novipirellula artificiosorum]TWU42394.1 hypothetical protein Poly41_06910 [Novipirellula artificiosorum]
MSSSNVRSIDSLAAFHAALLRFSSDADQTVQEIRTFVFRAQEYFSTVQPGYWRHQSQLAERELTEAKDNLAQKRAAIRPGDRPAATEAVARVKKAELRMRFCEEKRRVLKSVAVEVSKACDDLLGPLSDVREHCETILPQAARELAVMIQQLRLYADQANHNEE